jgi:hypothetical protein
LPKKALPENRFILCVLALFQVRYLKNSSIHYKLYLFSKQQFSKQNAKNSSVSAFFQESIHLLGSCFSEEMIRLDIGINQGFSQCEDWSVCNNRMYRAQSWKSETFGGLPALFFS